MKEKQHEGYVGHWEREDVAQERDSHVLDLNIEEK